MAAREKDIGVCNRCDDDYAFTTGYDPELCLPCRTMRECKECGKMFRSGFKQQRICQHCRGVKLYQSERKEDQEEEMHAHLNDRAARRANLRRAQREELKRK